MKRLSAKCILTLLSQAEITPRLFSLLTKNDETRYNYSMSPFFENLFLLLGTIIGAGIFSLPIALRNAGWVYFFIFILALSVILAKVNLFYREIVEKVKERHQFPGYVNIILGPAAAKLAVLLILFSTLGALVAYLIIGGSFLSAVIGTTPWSGSIIFFAVVFCILLFTGKKLEAFDVLFTIIKLILLAVIIITTSKDLVTFSLRFIPTVGESPMSAYGAILFSLTGLSIVPELKKDSAIDKSMYIAQLLVLAFYIFFAVSFYPYFSSNGIVFKNMLFDITGVFAILTPYLMLSWVGYDLFNKDLNIPKRTSLLAIVCIPLVLFLAGLQSFMSIISLTGGVFLGGTALLIAIMYKKRFPGKHGILIPIIEMIFLLGIIIQVWLFFQ